MQPETKEMFRVRNAPGERHRAKVQRMRPLVGVICFILLTLMPSYSFKMRGGLAITIFAVLALSAMVRAHSHFVPQPTAPIPAVNVP